MDYCIPDSGNTGEGPKVLLISASVGQVPAPERRQDPGHGCVLCFLLLFVGSSHYACVQWISSLPTGQSSGELTV